MDTPASLTSKRIGCIGCGNMGGAILGGLAEVPGLELYGYNRTPQRLEPLCAKGVTAVPDIPGIAARCDILVIGVKPYLVGGVLAEALPSLKPETVVISIAAGLRSTICATRYRAAAMWCASCRIPPPSWAQACSASRRIRRCPKTCSP